MGPERLSNLGREALKFWDGRPWDFGSRQEFGTRGIGILHLGASDFGNGARCLEIWDEAPRNLGREASDFGTGALEFWDRRRWILGTGRLGILGMHRLEFWDATCGDFGTGHVGF